MDTYYTRGLGLSIFSSMNLTYFEANGGPQVLGQDGESHQGRPGQTTLIKKLNDHVTK